jgi:hypothetical protein
VKPTIVLPDAGDFSNRLQAIHIILNRDSSIQGLSGGKAGALESTETREDTLRAQRDLKIGCAGFEAWAGAAAAW